MLPQFPAIPLQSTEATSDSNRNLNQLLPVGKNVSATVVAISRDQIQPEIFRLKLEINSRLIQMGVFQALPVGQKINVNRQSDGQIQITPQTNSQQAAQTSDKTPSQPSTTQARPGSGQTNILETNIRLQSSNVLLSAKLPDVGKLIAAVISSRPVYPQTISAPPLQTSTLQSANIAPQTNIIAPQPASPAPTPAGQTAFTSQTQSSGATVTQPQTSQSAPVAAQTPPTNSPPAISRPIVQEPPLPSGTAANRVDAAITPGTSRNNTNPAQQPTPATTDSSRPVPTNNAPPLNTQTVKQPVAQPSVPSAPQTPVPGTENPSIQTQLQAGANTTGQPRISPPPIFHAITLALPDGSKIEMNSSQALPQGAQVVLQKSAPNEAVISKIQLPNITPSSALDKPAIQEVLRNSLPIQLPVGDAFAQLSQAAAAAEGSQVSQISSVVRSMLQLFGVSPGSQDAATQIRQNIELGGLSTERNLSEGKAANPQDMKSQLQQLQNLAERLPAEQRERFEQLLQGLHSRITSQQLNSLQQWRELPDGGFERILQLDLPIKQGDKWDNLELRLSREGGSNAAGELVSIWRVRLHFDLDELGGVDAEIRLSDGHEISTYFWCDKPETAEKLRGRADDFAERLRQCGFSNSEVQWHQGAAPEQKQTVHRQLVDLHT